MRRWAIVRLFRFRKRGVRPPPLFRNPRVLCFFVVRGIFPPFPLPINSLVFTMPSRVLLGYSAAFSLPFLALPLFTASFWLRFRFLFGLLVLFFPPSRFLATRFFLAVFSLTFRFLFSAFSLHGRPLFDACSLKFPCLFPISPSFSMHFSCLFHDCSLPFPCCSPSFPLPSPFFARAACFCFISPYTIKSD